MGQLTDGLNALIRYSNEVTGASDGTLSDAVHTLCEGYGQGGGGVVDEMADVLFIDYDGTPLFGYTLEEAHALTSLPTPPAHEGLIFDGWSYTLDELRNVREGAEIGPYYKTASGGMRLIVYSFGGDFVLQSRWGAMKVSIPNVGEYTISSSGSTTISFPSKGEYEVFLEGTGAQAIEQCYPQISSSPHDTAFVKEINFPSDFYWESWYNPSSMRAYCERVTFPKSIDGLKSMGSTFSGWKKLKYAPFVYRNIPATSAYSSCSSLKYVSIPPFVSSKLETLMPDVALTRLHINSPITDDSRISPGARVQVFKKTGNVSTQMADGCGSLKKFSTSDECTTIGNYAFRGTTLEYLRLGPNVTSIGTSAFETIRVLVSEAITPPTLTSGFTCGLIFVPDASVDSYKGASVWSNYASYIRPMSELNV